MICPRLPRGSGLLIAVLVTFGVAAQSVHAETLYSFAHVVAGNVREGGITDYRALDVHDSFAGDPVQATGTWHGYGYDHVGTLTQMWYGGEAWASAGYRWETLFSRPELKVGAWAVLDGSFWNPDRNPSWIEDPERGAPEAFWSASLASFSDMLTFMAGPRLTSVSLVMGVGGFMARAPWAPLGTEARFDLYQYVIDPETGMESRVLLDHHLGLGVDRQVYNVVRSEPVVLHDGANGLFSLEAFAAVGMRPFNHWIPDYQSFSTRVDFSNTVEWIGFVGYDAQGQEVVIDEVRDSSGRLLYRSHVVPEPASLTSLVIGMVALCLAASRRWRSERDRPGCGDR